MIKNRFFSPYTAAALAALSIVSGCGLQHIPHQVVDAVGAPNLEIIWPAEGQEVIIQEGPRLLIKTRQERRTPDATMTAQWRLLEWSSLAYAGRWPANGNDTFQLNIPPQTEGQVELIMQLNEGDRVVERTVHFSMRWPKVNRVETKGSTVRVSFPPGEEARGAWFRLHTRPDADSINLDKLTFGPMDAKSAKECQGNIKMITLEYKNFQGRTNTATAPATHDCRATFGFAGDRHPFVGRDGKAELRMSVQTTRRDEGGHSASFKLGLIPEEFRAIGIDTGHIITDVKPQPVLHITILEPRPRS